MVVGKARGRASIPACPVDGKIRRRKWDGVGMDAKLYMDVLTNELLKPVEHCRVERGNFVFQHDNDPKHASKLATEWLSDHKIEVLYWLALSIP